MTVVVRRWRDFVRTGGREGVHPHLLNSFRKVNVLLQGRRRRTMVSRFSMLRLTFLLLLVTLSRLSAWTHKVHTTFQGH